MKTKLLAILLMAAVAAPVALAAPQATAQPSLYKRLGGYDALAAVTDDALARFIADPQLARFFAGMNNASKKRVRQHFVDFLCEISGGPCAYHGRDMKTAHDGMNISEQDWTAAVNDLKATLDKFKVPAKEQGEVLGAVSSLKADIVHVAK